MRSVQDQPDATSPISRTVVTAPTFAPDSSPQTTLAPVSADSSHNKLLRGVYGPLDGTFPQKTIPVIVRKPVGSPSKIAGRPAPGKDAEPSIGGGSLASKRETPSNARERSNSKRFEDLKQLPRVKMIYAEEVLPVHTEVAGHTAVSMPHHADTGAGATPVQTSGNHLPCPRNSLCNQLHPLMMRSGVRRMSGPCQSQPEQPIEGEKPRLNLYLAYYAMVVLSFVTHVFRDQGQPQPLKALNTLTSDSAAPAQRVAALEALVSGIGRLSVILAAVMVVWRVGAAVRDVLECVFWPLSVAVKALRWMLTP
ncbi:hypothetical protein LTR66_002635 [Elasticomyces elasticus]|nr:hypothetical protein LTR66_002635 [Elasticomyces elasticus]